MLEFLTPHSDNDAIVIIKKDHARVQELFEQFEKAEQRADKVKIVGDAIRELKTHAAIEEDIFYATVRAKVGKKVMNEADEEHHVAKMLIAELEDMDGSEDHYDAKFTVLAENIRHHIKEEEGHMLPKARSLDIDFDALGMKILEEKKALAQQGFPGLAEEAVVRRSGGRGDSPAANARKKPVKLPRRTAPGRAGVNKSAPTKTKVKSSRSKPKSASMTKTVIKKVAKLLKTQTRPSPSRPTKTATKKVASKSANRR